MFFRKYLFVFQTKDFQKQPLLLRLLYSPPLHPADPNTAKHSYYIYSIFKRRPRWDPAATRLNKSLTHCAEGWVMDGRDTAVIPALYISSLSLPLSADSSSSGEENPGSSESSAPITENMHRMRLPPNQVSAQSRLQPGSFRCKLMFSSIDSKGNVILGRSENKLWYFSFNLRGIKWFFRGRKCTSFFLVIPQRPELIQMEKFNRSDKLFRAKIVIIADSISLSSPLVHSPTATCCNWPE